MRRLVMLVMLGAVAGTASAAPFAKDWREEWALGLEHACDADEVVRRTPEGALEIDTPDGGHVNWVGGEPMHDFAVTARVKFLRADDKYSGFSLFVRWNGEVWAERDCYWIYLRPKFRSLYMQKVMGGKLDKAFQETIEAVRPKATPLNEWLTLRVEVRGRRIEVYLRPQGDPHDKLHLSATDDGLFPILSGSVGFGAGNAHVMVADVEQTNLEESDRLEIESYEYVNPPDRGDEGRTILTDGEVNPRASQAFWRMLGETPEIVFDLGRERFITRIALRAISAPAVNIASAEVLASPDGEQWRTVAMVANEDSRRAEAEHVVEGPVRAVARYVRLILSRPAADQDVELAEVELYGREPTEEDRKTAAAAAYDTGPAMPETSEAGREDEHYWYLESEAARFAIDKQHGLVGGVWSREHGAKCIERLSDGYYLYTRDGDAETEEYADEVAGVLDRGDRMIRLRCRNPRLPEIEIEKTYSISPDGRRLIKRVGWTNTGDAQDRFLTHQTGGVA
ncbi:MAG: discoidin domain-containing protein, partial [Armatimonadota bacterium]